MTPHLPVSSLVASLPAPTPNPILRPIEAVVRDIPISGLASASQAEFSGMAWYGDTLILLPQYPDRFGSGDNGAVFTLPKADILAFLEGNISGPLQPTPIPFIDSGLAGRIKGFEGYESIAIQGDRVYLTIEANPGGMLGYLISGKIDPDLKEIRLDTLRWTEIPAEANFANMSYEAILAAGKREIVFFEANGTQVNPQPVARSYDNQLVFQGDIPIPNLEYRLTDVTPPDAYGRFWAINYFYPGETFLASPNDPLAEKYGEGLTHSQNQEVERLVEFQFTEDGIALSGQTPIQLQLPGDGQERNWEGIARLDGQGFLLVTDQYPETILGFVAGP